MILGPGFSLREIRGSVELNEKMALHLALEFAAETIVVDGAGVAAKLDDLLAAIAANAGDAVRRPRIERMREQLHGDALVVIGGAPLWHFASNTPASSAE